MNGNPWSWRNVKNADVFEIISVKVNKLPSDCSVCLFSNISSKGNLFCNLLSVNQFIREVKISKNYSIPKDICKLEINK